jgi:hypothetical protein
VGSIPTLGSIGGFQYRITFRTNIHLESRQARALDEAAKAQWIRRAELVRQLIDRGIAGHALDLEADLAAIEASFGALPEVGDLVAHVRAPDDRARHLNRIAGG